RGTVCGLTAPESKTDSGWSRTFRAMSHDADLVAAQADRLLPLAGATLSEEYFYQSLPLCVIDAVYSVGVRYESVRGVVARYCRRFGLTRVREDRTVLPPRDEQESVSSFCDRFQQAGVAAMTGD